MKEKLILNCVFHEENTPSMILTKADQSFECFSCGKKGLINDHDEVRLALLRNLFSNENIYLGCFKQELIERCCDHYPIQIVLNSGVIIECMTDEIDFYDDHFQLSQVVGQTSAKIIFPKNMPSEFHPRQVWVLYSSISFVTDNAS